MDANGTIIGHESNTATDRGNELTRAFLARVNASEHAYEPQAHKTAVKTQRLAVLISHTALEMGICTGALLILTKHHVAESCILCNPQRCLLPFLKAAHQPHSPA
jgi:hypothetical protein